MPALVLRRPVYIALACLLFLAALVLINPVVEMGMNDDWSFIKTARDVAIGGRLRFNGWSAPLIGIQAYWGALFIKIFGFSFSAARFSTMTLTLLSIPLLFQLASKVGLGDQASFFLTLSVLFSPLFLPNATLFMTDVPGFLLFMAALLAGLKAWETANDSKAAAWSGVLTVLGIASGSVRQFYWLAAVWFLLVLGIYRFHNWHGRILAGLEICLTAAVAYLATRWLNAQPYFPKDQAWTQLRQMPFGEVILQTATGMLRLVVTVAVLLLPVTVAFAGAWGRKLTRLLIFTVAAILAFVAGRPIPWLGNFLSEAGILPSNLVVAGEKPIILGAYFTWFVAMVAIACALGTTLLAIQRLHKMRVAGIVILVTNSAMGRLLLMAVPFFLAYLAIIGLRAPVYGLYDRYVIPIVPLLAIALLYFHAHETAKCIPVSSYVLLILFAVYATATTHDFFSLGRSRAQAATELERAGISRTSILGGFEYDSWTQTELTGHINNATIAVPADAYHQADDCNGPDAVQMWWRSLVPDVKPSFVLTVSPLEGMKRASFPAVPFRTWIPPKRNFLLVEEVQAADAPLHCVAEVEEK